MTKTSFITTFLLITAAIISFGFALADADEGSPRAQYETVYQRARYARSAPKPDWNKPEEAFQKAQVDQKKLKALEMNSPEQNIPGEQVVSDNEFAAQAAVALRNTKVAPTAVPTAVNDDQAPASKPAEKSRVVVKPTNTPSYIEF